MLRALAILACALLGSTEGQDPIPKIGDRPNIVLIVSDDQGYADIGINPHRPKEVATPHLDALAREGAFFTQAYTSGNVCSPTRAGLLTGRYQQRCGIYTAGEGGSGLPLKERIAPQFLKPAGYVSGAFGKWHLGLTPEYNPVNRGFDEFYGFMGRGAHDYFKLAGEGGEEPLYRNLEEVRDKGYLTTRLTEEACTFVRRHRERPFFLYLAYNAVHAPAQAPEEDVRKFTTGDPQRDILMAMLQHLDRGVGRVVTTLKELGLYEKTLVLYLSDNGGSKAMHANNAPLRGYKQQYYEGGIRTPLLLSWPAKVRGGLTIDTPVLSLDVLPSLLAAAGVPAPADKPLDGTDLVALANGGPAPSRDLYWSSGSTSGKWAVRSGDWKLVAHNGAPELYDLRKDPAETRNLASENPDTATRLRKLHEAWMAAMAPPVKKGK